MTFHITYYPAARQYAGTLDISDFGARFTANIPVHSGRYGISQTGRTVKGTLYGIKSLSTPKKCFLIVFEKIEDGA